MKKLIASWMLLSFAAMLPAGTPREKRAKYGFATKDYSIQMAVTFFRPYVGRRLAFVSTIDPGKQVCYSADGSDRCVEHLVGALAVGQYSVRLANGGIPRSGPIREDVTASAHSAGLPERAPVPAIQTLTNGIASDIQAFGYDESALSRAERTRGRKKAQAKLWRLCRQELYMNQDTKPFAIVEWKHTLNGISIVRIYAPSDGE